GRRKSGPGTGRTLRSPAGRPGRPAAGYRRAPARRDGLASGPGPVRTAGTRVLAADRPLFAPVGGFAFLRFGPRYPAERPNGTMSWADAAAGLTAGAGGVPRCRGGGGRIIWAGDHIQRIQRTRRRADVP